MPDIEFQALSRAVQDRDFDALALAGITTTFFLDPDNAAIFDWMREHWNKYGSSPSEDAFYQEYPHDSLEEAPEPLAYYIDELRDQRRAAMLQDTLDSIREPLKNQDTDIAIKLLGLGLDGIHQEVTELLDERMNDTGEERMSYYQDMTTIKGLLGWPTGFQSMDRATAGIQKGQLITLAGNPKVKKSMLLMCMCIAAHNAGANVMYVTFEMTIQEQRVRHDALRSGISLSHLQRPAQLEDWEWKKLSRTMHSLEDMQSMWFVHDPWSTTTVSAIRAKINLHRPIDMVFVDGAYMMECEDPNLMPSSPQALTSITRSLKRLAQQADVAVIQTTQALLSRTPKGKLNLGSIGYSSSFAQDSDVVFGVEAIKNEDGTNSDDEAILKILASRNCSPRDVRLIVDLDHGSILEGEDLEYEDDDDVRTTML